MIASELMTYAFLFGSGIMYAFVSRIRPVNGFNFVDCLLFGAMISATDPGTTLYN